MPIQVGTTVVIDENHIFKNITGASGNYDRFFPNVEVITNTIDFTTPMMAIAMTANVTFSESNKVAGKAAMLLMDRSSDEHTPTFSSNIKWSGGSEPTWADYRHWMISLHCVDGTTVRASVAGYTATAAPPPTETISLLGTSTQPVDYFGDLPLVDGFGNASQQTGFRFGGDGNIYKRSQIGRPNPSWGWSFYSLNEWCNVTPSKTYFIKATLQSKVSNGTPDPDAGSTLEAWHELGGIRNVDFYSNDTRDFADYTPSGWTIKVEIADVNYSAFQYSLTNPRYYWEETDNTDGEGLPITTVRVLWNDSARIFILDNTDGATELEGFNDGFRYARGTMETDANGVRTYRVSQGTYNILDTGYYNGSWESGA